MGTDKELEKLVDKMMEEVPLESPSSNFTHLVMQEVAKVQQTAAAYKPLISKRTIFIVLGALGVLGYYLFSLNTGSNESIEAYIQPINDAKNWISNALPTLQFSKTLSYIIGAIGAMVCFQTFMLKRYFNNRWA